MRPLIFFTCFVVRGGVKSCHGLEKCDEIRTFWTKGLVLQNRVPRVRVLLPLPKQIPLLIQSCRQRYRYFTAKNIGRISTYKNKRCILGVFHPSCNAFLIVFIAPPQDLTQHSYRPIVKQPHFVKRLINEIIKIFQGIFS